ncbi:hypothetical protein DYH56_04625 [Psychrilyobacter piezotolerans]|uniref:YidE/YbjL duplication domain-containing protein n=2 Tax=Fusobacteriaceae TaxID=203492 RepID=A0ABX9KJY3_9FUSO|nr:hypothetical protein [Psychrilyobacter piezotolerans]RDE63778.1 hypothetical protein DV867_04625 [Psychrilyobacter sp. S5]REI42122.1 hypothetical protein DYH56_04625 [Psychrilyobacter piezotolerans]
MFKSIHWLTNPFTLMFITIYTGLILGRILKIGTSGTLFSGLGIGWWIVKIAHNMVDTQGPNTSIFESLLKVSVIDKKFFTLFLILFVATIGLLVADNIAVIVKKYGTKFIALGFLIVFIGAGTTYVLTTVIKKINPYEVSGVYTGALTSSPGLAAAIEASREHAKEWAEKYPSLSQQNKKRILNILDPKGTLTPINTSSLSPDQVNAFILDAESKVGIGYAVGYPFGVLMVILAMKLFPKIFRLNLEKEYKEFRKEMDEIKNTIKIKYIEPVRFDTLAFFFTCITGYTLGMIKINLGPLGYFSLGSTGAILVTSTFLGYIGKIGFMTFRMDKKIIGVISEISLTFFLSVVGLRYGFATINSLMGDGIYLCLFSILISLFSMFIGFVVGKYVFKINWIMLSGAICGGMTSTPGLGAAVDTIGSDDPAAGYAATYPFALFGMVLFTIILHKLI